MGVSGGPKIVSDDLVLCLDARDANSYAGEPTTNMITDGDCNDGNLPDNMHFGYNKTYSVVDCPYDDDGFRPANKAIKFVKTNSTDGRFTFLNISSLSTGTNNPYVVSCWVYIPTNSTATVSSGRPRWNTDNGGNSLNLSYIDQYEGKKGKWARVSSKWYSVNGSQTHGLRGISGDPTGSIMYITNVQNELKSYTTPFVDGSRSATNGWTDLSANGNHGTLTNMLGTETSHRRVGQVIEPISNAYLNFDGTDDYVTLGTPEILNFSGSTSPTVIAWIKTSSSAEAQILRTSQSSKYLIFGIASGKLRAQIYDGTNNANDENNNGPTINDGNWHHVAAVFNRGGNIIFYKNGAATTGVSMASVTGETGTPSPYAAIGRRPGGSQYYDGKIACMHIYNKALSAAEIKQNFNAQRRRFGV